jgi:hypothetical protein
MDDEFEPQVTAVNGAAQATEITKAAASDEKPPFLLGYRANSPDSHPSRRSRHRIRFRLICAVLAVVGALAFGLVDDLQTQLRLHHDKLALVDSRAELQMTSRLLVVSLKKLDVSIATKQAEQTTLNELEGELSSADERLSQAKSGFESENLNVSTLRVCLSGVVQATKNLQAHNPQVAVSEMAGVAPPCEKLEGASPGGPVYPFDFPDPDVIDVHGTYFAYGTNSAGGNVQVIESRDLLHWKTLGDALPQLASWATPGFTWAPGVLQLRDHFLLYYATVVAGTSQMCLSVASAGRPQGPFIDTSRSPLVCDGTGGAIDPDPYLDASGNPYLAWKSNGGDGEPTSIWSEALSSPGTTVAAKNSPVALLEPTQDWEAGNVEGPDMFLWHGSYYLFYAGNNFDSSGYAIGVAVCQGPLGPCSKPLNPIHSVSR